MGAAWHVDDPRKCDGEAPQSWNIAGNTCEKRGIAPKSGFSRNLFSAWHSCAVC